jgi:dihydroorotase
MYAPPPNGMFDDAGRLLPDVSAARKRGVWFDIGNGRIGHIRWDIAEQGLTQGFAPDTISSDWTDASRIEQVFDFPNVLSKFLMLGMPLNDVIARATSHSAQLFPAFKGLGTLRVGAPADIAVLELRNGDFPFVDNFTNVRHGRQKLFTRAVVVGGKRAAVAT